MTRITVLVADAQRLFADALSRSLAQSDDLVLLQDRPATGIEAAEVIVRSKPDVALFDYWMSEMEGPAAARALKGWAPGVKVILTSWFHGPPQVEAALEAGAVGFLPKSLDVDDVAEAIRRAHAGENPVHAEQLERLVSTLERKDEESRKRWERLMSLTPREVQVLQHLSRGRPSAEIAKELSITPGTLGLHVQNIMKKTNAGSRIEAIAMARAEKLIQS